MRKTVVIDQLERRTFLSTAPLSPAEDLPWNIRNVNPTAERPSFSPDGRKMAYVDREFGDAWELDLASGTRKSLTARLNHAPGWMRVHYLPNGDYVLTASRRIGTTYASRWNEAEIWVMPKAVGAGATPMGERLNEGVAVSRIANRLAWAATPSQYPGQIGVKLWVAEVAYSNGVPRLTNKRQVAAESKWMEAQDFRNNDGEVLGPLYSPSRVVGYRTDLGRVAPRTVYRQVTGEYNETEGAFPDGGSVLVESNRDKIIPAGAKPEQYIDVWRLKLSPGTDDFRRVTRFGDFPGWKTNNPVVSNDGNFVAFQQARIGTNVGNGQGIFVLKLDATPAGAVKKLDEPFDRSPSQTGWTVTPTGTTVVSASAGAVRLAGKVTLVKTLSTRGVKDLSLLLAARQSSASFTARDKLRIDVDTGYGWVRLLTDAQKWRGADNATGDNGYSSPGTTSLVSTGYLALPRSAAGKDRVRVRVTVDTGSTDRSYYLDRLEVAGTSTTASRTTIAAAGVRAITFSRVPVESVWGNLDSDLFASGADESGADAAA